MTQQEITPARSMRPFMIVWFGQLISTLGSSLTSFGLGFWLLRETGSVTDFALVNVFYLLPIALVSPIAGAVVDRYDRKRIMLIADTAQALTTLGLAVLFRTGMLEPWHIFLTTAISSIAGTFQNPAWMASISMIVPKDQLGRAAGMGRLSEALSRVLGPVMAGTLVVLITLEGLIIIDFITYFVAMGTLLFVRIPNPPRVSDDAPKEKRNLWSDIVFGWRYLVGMPGLFIFIVLISLRNLFANFALTLRTPLMLTITNEAVIGMMFSITSLGMLLGTGLMSGWGGPKKNRIPFVLALMILEGLACFVVGWRASVILFAVCGFVWTFAFALLATNIGPVLQTKIAPDVQGRIFAMIGFVATILEPMGQIAVGPLTDRVFEPMMMADGALAPIFGPLIGVGEGRGMGLVFLLMGVGMILLGVYGLLDRRVRNIETLIPDAIPDEPAPPLDAPMPAVEAAAT